MDAPEKPFKTIEVVDARTDQLCKVACMSCIRGHRTTSCGIPVCRTKVFWTVKRPGRPSNSCTCRFGATGRCQCVVAKSACPHKPRKGEKRSVDCRCDEQGRYCCLLEPEHWDALCALQKPRVEFFGSREALDARHVSPPGPTAFPLTPARSVSSPRTVSSAETVSTPGNGIHFVHTTGEHFSEVQSPVRPTTTRFGMMGIGAPLGDNNNQGRDVLTWDGQAPPAPREFEPYPGFKHNTQQHHVPAASPGPMSGPPTTPYPYMPTPDQQYPTLDYPPLTQSLEGLSLPSHPIDGPHPSTTFDFDKIMADYFQYQFPAAICQHCGMSGCTCRSCPAVMQSFESGSWAQCCSKKHMRPGPQHPPSSTAVAAHMLPAGVDGQDAEDGRGCCKPAADVVPGIEMSETAFSAEQMPFDELKLLGDGTTPMDLSEFLMSDLEQPAGGGCCCGGARDEDDVMR